MHTRLAQIYAQFLPLRIHPLPFDIPLISESIQWNRFTHRQPALIWLRAVMLAIAAGLGDIPTARVER